MSPNSTDALSATQWRSQCPVSCALDMVGDKWSLLILRDLLFSGDRTYGELLGSSEGISTNILASRLARLSDLGLIERQGDGATRGAPYQLTDSGAGLEPVLKSLAAWASEHLAEANPNMITISDLD